MPLKITKAYEPIEVKTITMTLYAVPGVGKSTIAFTAAKPLLLDFDRGSYRAGNRGDVVQVETWQDVMGISQEDLAPYKTLILDTAGRALDVLGVHVMKVNPKAAKRSGGMSLEGFGDMKNAFIAWTKLIKSFGLDLVLLSHSDEQKDGDDTKERLDIVGGSKNEIYKASDAMGRIYFENGKRTLSFSPTDTAFGKNPAQLAPLVIPDYDKGPTFLADVIAQTKAHLNKLSAEQTEVSGLLASWNEKVSTAKAPADFNALIMSAKELDERIRDNGKRILVKAAKDREILFDTATSAFVGKEPAAQETASTNTPANDNAPEAPKAATKKERGKKGTAAEPQGELLAPAAGDERVPGAEG